MIAKEPIEALTALPEDAQQIVLALSIVISRIGTLPKDDRNDLFELMKTWPGAKDQAEQKEIQMAMIEILTQSPIIAMRALQVGSPSDTGSEQWATHVGRKIRSLREEAGLTQVELAKKSGLPQSHVSRLENAEHTATNITLEKIAKALGVQVGDIDPCAE